MTFSSYSACTGTASFCGEYILANGMITSDTPNKLEILLKAQKFKPTIYFNSPGGNLLAGMKLGYIIRSLIFDTYVGGPYNSAHLNQSNGQFNESIVTIVAKGVCLSACAYAFLGGVSRHLDAGGQLGVHQFSGGAKDVGQSAAQVTTAVLAQYLDDMGVDRKLLDIASMTPSGSVQIISVQLARELNVDNTNPPKRGWELKADDQGNLSAIVTQRQGGRDAVTSLAFRRDGSYLIGTLTYRIRQNFRSFRQMNETFQGPTRFHLTASDQSYQTTTVSSWERLVDGSFRIRFSVNPSILLKLSQLAAFELDAEDWGNAMRDVDPSTEFGTEGLRNAVLALLK
jgi:hypothetical protein